jgi:DNA polymerase elongation subunit (family B)
MSTFHILDSLAQDIFLKETEETAEITFVDKEYEEDDAEVKTRKRTAAAAAAAQKQTFVNRKMVIHLFGATADGTPLRVNVTGFEPFFFVRLPSDAARIETLFQKKVAATLDETIEVDISFTKRKTLFGYSGGAEFPFARLAVKSLEAWRAVKSVFLNKECEPIFHLEKGGKPLEVYEANLDPMLRFFHLRGIQPCGWVTIPEEAEDGADVFVAWDAIEPCSKPPVPAAPFLIASWDIECYSENGEFPIPKRGYERAAKLLVANGASGQESMHMVQQAMLYPEAPPPGMDPLRMRAGGLPTRKKLDPVFVAAFAEELDSGTKGEVKSVADRDARVKKVADSLTKRLRAFPLAGDPIIQIGVVLQRGGAGKPEKHIFVLGTCDAVAEATVHAFTTEKAMLQGWAAAMRAWNPDILLGYNTFGFDENYLWVRATELGIVTETKSETGWTKTECGEDFHALTRLWDRQKDITLQTKFLSSSALGDNTMYIWSTHGRLQIDLYHYVKRGYALPSYKLDDVCQHFMSGKLSSVDTGEKGSVLWTLKTKATADVIPGRSIVLLDETGDAVVDKLRVVSVVKGEAVVIEAPTGDDADDLAIAAATAVKWAIVKDDVSPQEIFKFHRGSAADRAAVAAYCIQDCVLVLDLYKKLDVFNNAMAMANACSVPVAYIFTRGQGIKIESLIFKECYERNQAVLVLPQPTEAAEGQEESYEGAIVLDPIPGFYFDSPIGVADFASLYPSTIISENISYDTLVWVKNYRLDGTFAGYALGSAADEAYADPTVRWTDITFDIWGTDPADKRKHPAKIKTGLRVCRYAQNVGEAKGTLPQIVAALLAKRKAKRKEGEKETDPFRKALLDAEQLAYKLTANSLYGQLGSSTFKIRLQHLAASVTAYGRKQIMFAKAAIEEFYGPAAGDPRCSAEMVYGDTDSLFVNFNVRDPATGEPLKGTAALEATMHLTEEAGKFVSQSLAAPHDFEYDKVFTPFIIFSKKRYVGNKYEESTEHYSQTSMGIATKRRDYAPLVKVIYGGALRILLTERNIQGAIDFVKTKLVELVEGKMSLNLLTMSKSLRAEYRTPTPPAHKVLAQRIAERDPGNAPASGDRIPFIYVQPPPGQLAAKLQGDRVETPTWIRAKGLKPDYRFYIEHQLMNPIVQLFSLVADRIPGIVVPPTGWPSEGDAACATTEAIFRPVFNLCDRIATQQFGAKLFGTQVEPVGSKRKTISVETNVAVQQPPPKKSQTNINSYFANKLLIDEMRASKTPKTESK